MKEALEVLDHVRLNFSPAGLLALNVTIAFIMFGVALDIKIQHFKDLVMNPKSVIVGVVSQFLLLAGSYFSVYYHVKSNSYSSTWNDIDFSLSRRKYFQFHDSNGQRECSLIG
jgi:hypothetical protein